jgi:hypothetical protein
MSRTKPIGLLQRVPGARRPCVISGLPAVADVRAKLLPRYHHLLDLLRESERPSASAADGDVT